MFAVAERDELREVELVPLERDAGEDLVGPDGARLAAIDVVIEVKGADLNHTQRADLVRAAEQCKIHNTLKAGCEIRLTVAPAPAAEATSAQRPGCCA